MVTWEDKRAANVKLYFNQGALGDALTPCSTITLIASLRVARSMKARAHHWKM